MEIHRSYCIYSSRLYNVKSTIDIVDRCVWQKEPVNGRMRETWSNFHTPGVIRCQREKMISVHDDAVHWIKYFTLKQLRIWIEHCKYEKSKFGTAAFSSVYVYTLND